MLPKTNDYGFVPNIDSDLFVLTNLPRKKHGFIQIKIIIYIKLHQKK